MQKLLHFALYAVVTGITCCTAVSKATAQTPVIQWAECLGGSATDEAESIQQTNDGGYFIAGFTNSTDSQVTGNHGGADYWVVKLSASGSLQWEKCLGGSNSDIGAFAAQTKDNGYIVTGYSNSNDSNVTGNHGGWDYWVVKLNDTGAIQWQKSFGGDTTDIPKCIQQTTDSGYIVAGNSMSRDGDVTGNHGTADCWIVKMSAAGDIQWERSYGGSGGDGGVSIKQTFDSGYIVACSSNSADGDVTGNHGDYDVWVLKLSSSGAIQWEKSYGGSGTDYADCIQQTPDSGYIVAGTSNSNDGDVTGNHGGFDYWVIKLSSAGVIQWEQSYGGSSDEFAASVQQTRDGGYVVAGTTFSNDSEISGFKGMSDMWVTKLSSTGSLQWQKTFGGSSYDGAESIWQSIDSGYVIAGYTSSSDSDVYGNHGNTDFWVVKLGDSPRADTTGSDTTKTVVALAGAQSLILITPNPTTGIISISGTYDCNIKVYNTFGQLIKEANNTNNISIAEFPSGSYFILVFDNCGFLIKQDKIIKN